MTVLDYDMLGGSDPIGKVVLGKNRKKLEKKHWVEMIENPRRPIIHWHVLKVNKGLCNSEHHILYESKDPEPGDDDEDDDKKKKEGKKDAQKKKNKSEVIKDAKK